MRIRKKNVQSTGMNWSVRSWSDRPRDLLADVLEDRLDHVAQPARHAVLRPRARAGSTISISRAATHQHDEVVRDVTWPISSPTAAGAGGRGRSGRRRRRAGRGRGVEGGSCGGRAPVVAARRRAARATDERLEDEQRRVVEPDPADERDAARGERRTRAPRRRRPSSRRGGPRSRASPPGARLSTPLRGERRRDEPEDRADERDARRRGPSRGGRPRRRRATSATLPTAHTAARAKAAAPANRRREGVTAAIKSEGARRTSRAGAPGFETTKGLSNQEIRPETIPSSAPATSNQGWVPHVASSHDRGRKRGARRPRTRSPRRVHRTHAGAPSARSPGAGVRTASHFVSSEGIPDGTGSAVDATVGSTRVRASPPMVAPTHLDRTRSAFPVPVRAPPPPRTRPLPEATRPQERPTPRSISRLPEAPPDDPARVLGAGTFRIPFVRIRRRLRLSSGGSPPWPSSSGAASRSGDGGDPPTLFAPDVPDDRRPARRTREGLDRGAVPPRGTSSSRGRAR